LYCYFAMSLLSLVRIFRLYFLCRNILKGSCSPLPTTTWTPICISNNLHAPIHWRVRVMWSVHQFPDILKQICKRLDCPSLSLQFPSHASSLPLLTSFFINSSLGSHSSSSTSPGCTSERLSPKLREISLFICILGPPQWRTDGGGLRCSTPPPPPKFRRPSKIVPNSARLWKLLKIAEFRTPTLNDVRKKGSKILKLPRFAIVLH